MKMTEEERITVAEFLSFIVENPDKIKNLEKRYYPIPIDQIVYSYNFFVKKIGVSVTRYTDILECTVGFLKIKLDDFFLFDFLESLYKTRKAKEEESLKEKAISDIRNILK